MVFSKYKKSPIVLVLLIGLMALSGCGWRKQDKMQQVAMYAEQKDGLDIVVKKLSKTEAQKMLGADVFSAGYVPLLIGIRNGTDDMLLLRGQSIHASLADPGAVAYRLQFSATTWTLYLSYFSALFYWPALVPAWGVGYYMQQRNSSICSNIAISAFGRYDSLDILPYEYVGRIIFVHARDYSPRFRFHLFNTHQKTFIPFSVALHSVDVDELQELCPLEAEEITSQHMMD